MHVARFAAAPGVQHSAGGADYYRNIRQNVFATEGRLDQAALALPSFSFIGQQAIAKHASKSAVVRGLREIACIGNQYVFDVAGMYQQTYGDGEITKVDHVA